MWNRVNREESNQLIKDIVKVQIKKVLPWFKQIIQIGQDLENDIIEGRKMKKEKWKNLVNKQINIAAKDEMLEEIGKLKKYQDIMKDELEVGKQKKYMSLPVRKAASFFRARTNQLDPGPRKPYWKKSKWRCCFCREKTQDTKHYILECNRAGEIMGSKKPREEIWRLITTLDGEEKEIKEVATSLQRLYREINR